MHSSVAAVMFFALVLAISATTHGQPTPAATHGGSTSARVAEASSAAELMQPTTQPTTSPFSLGGYVETYYQWNFNDPSNDLTNFRGFDNRHNTFTLSNVALDAKWDYERLIGHVTLQVGHTGSTYYLNEPSSPGAGGANTANRELWKYVQQAYAGYQFGDDRRLTIVAGLFLSPIGPEAMAVRDNWNWSRSNLFFGLPFYHTGARVTYALNDTWGVTLAAYNGWNSVDDNNRGKSISAQVTYTRPELIVFLLYFGGPERARGAAEGHVFRHLFDVHATWNATPWLSLLVHGNTGFEPNRFGLSRWAAAALYARVQVARQLHVVVRGDVFAEHTANKSTGGAAAIFWPAPWVSSATLTVDYHPGERVSFRLEYRHDQAGRDMYFGGDVPVTPVFIDETTTASTANRKSQDTLTLGATTWF